MIRLVLSLVLMVAGAAPGFAQETRRAVEGQPPRPARLSDLAWIAGAWEGEGISGPAREVYSPPAGGQIIGHFIQTRGDGIAFSEILSIAQVGDTLEYRLKHFNADLTGWEEKDEVFRFPLVGGGKCLLFRRAHDPARRAGRPDFCSSDGKCGRHQQGSRLSLPPVPLTAAAAAGA